VNDGSPDLGFDIVADHGEAALLEPILPVQFAGDKNRDTINKTTACLKYLLHIPFCGFLGTDRQVIHDNIGTGILQDLNDIGRSTGSGFNNLL